MKTTNTLMSQEEQLNILRSLKSGDTVSIVYIADADKAVPSRTTSAIVTNIMYGVYESHSTETRQEFQNMGGKHVEQGKTYIIKMGNMVINPKFVAEVINGYFEITLA